MGWVVQGNLPDNEPKLLKPADTVLDALIGSQSLGDPVCLLMKPRPAKSAISFSGSTDLHPKLRLMMSLIAGRKAFLTK